MKSHHRHLAACIAVVLAAVLPPAIRGQEHPYALTGALVTPKGIVDDGIIVIADGAIRAVGAGIAVPPGMPVIRSGGVIFPGLIDLHNHLMYNVFPRWQPATPVGDRYDWQAMSGYFANLSDPESAMIDRGDGCDMERYAEIKAMLGGATSVVGGYSPTTSDPHRNECDRGLARNLDAISGFYSSEVNAEPLDNEVFPFEISFARAQSIRDAMAAGKLKSLLIHVGEGKDASAAREFRMLTASGFLRPGVSVTHGVALNASNFAQMAHNGVGLIWSPRSNISLYGVTANVAAAKAAEVTMAIAPDWSPSGSNGMSEELRYAYEWNQRQHEPVFSPAEMVAMATSKPAQLAGVSDKAGALAAGYAADLVIYPRKGDSPLMALLDADPGNVELVVVGGKPMLGEPGIMKKLVRDAPLETLRVCNFTKSLNTRDDMAGESWDEVVTHLTEELKRFKLPLAELADCGDAHSPPETGPAQR